jgi:hypothetical protein
VYIAEPNTSNDSNQERPNVFAFFPRTFFGGDGFASF